MKDSSGTSQLSVLEQVYNSGVSVYVFIVLVFVRAFDNLNLWKQLNTERWSNVRVSYDSFRGVSSTDFLQQVPTAR